MRNFLIPSVSLIFLISLIVLISLISLIIYILISLVSFIYFLFFNPLISLVSLIPLICFISFIFLMFNFLILLFLEFLKYFFSHLRLPVRILLSAIILSSELRCALTQCHSAQFDNRDMKCSSKYTDNRICIEPRITMRQLFQYLKGIKYIIDYGKNSSSDSNIKMR